MTVIRLKRQVRNIDGLEGSSNVERIENLNGLQDQCLKLEQLTQSLREQVKELQAIYNSELITVINADT